MTNPLDIIFVDFGIWLLGYWIQFSCLSIPQGHYFISTPGYEVQINMSVFGFERKSTFKEASVHDWFSLNYEYSFESKMSW